MPRKHECLLFLCTAWQIQHTFIFTGTTVLRKIRILLIFSKKQRAEGGAFCESSLKIPPVSLRIWLRSLERGRVVSWLGWGSFATEFKASLHIPCKRVSCVLRYDKNNNPGLVCMGMLLGEEWEDECKECFPSRQCWTASFPPAEQQRRGWHDAAQ